VSSTQCSTVYTLRLYNSLADSSVCHAESRASKPRSHMDRASCVKQPAASVAAAVERKCV